MYPKPSEWICFLPFFVVLALLAVCSGCGTDDAEAQDWLSRGEKALAVYDFDTAHAELALGVASIAEDDPAWPRAAYALGLAAWHRTPPSEALQSEARRIFEHLSKSAADPHMRHRSLLNLGRIHEVSDFPADEADVEKARGYYRQVLEAEAEARLKARALGRLAQTHVDETSDESIRTAIDLLRNYLATAPADRHTGPLWQYMGELYGYELGEYRAALDAFLRAESIGFANESKADLYLWRMAGWAEALEDHDAAVRLYRKLIIDEPRSNYRSAARDRLHDLSEALPDRKIEIPELSPYGAF